MVVANFCVDGDGRHLGNTGGGTANMYAVMARLWGELAERGRITEAERRDCTLCNYYRTEEEVRRPFQPGGAAAEAGLKLLTCETRVTPCRYREDWLAQQRGAAGGGGGADARKHAAALIGTLRSWSNSTFLGALDESRGQAERELIVEEFWDSYVDLVAQSPEEHGMAYVHCFLTFEKAGGGGD